MIANVESPSTGGFVRCINNHKLNFVGDIMAHGTDGSRLDTVLPPLCRNLSTTLPENSPNDSDSRPDTFYISATGLQENQGVGKHRQASG